VSIRHPSRPSQESKRRRPAFVGISWRPADPPRSSGSPTPDEKACSLASLKAALADAAPRSEARARRVGEGQQQ
jgi:hypothetical protein